MFVWFSFKDSAIRLHLRPPTVQEHVTELAAYSTTKALVRSPANQRIPLALAKRLVTTSWNVMRGRA